MGVEGLHIVLSLISSFLPSFPDIRYTSSRSTSPSVVFNASHCAASRSSNSLWSLKSTVQDTTSVLLPTMGAEPTVADGAAQMMTFANVSTSARCQSSLYHALDSSLSSTVYRASAASVNVGPSIMTSFVEVVLQCNKFQQDISSLYEFWIVDHDSPIGYMLPEFVAQMVWSTTGFEIDDLKRTVHLKPKLDAGESIFTACEKEFVRLCRLNMTKVDGVRKWVEAWDLEGDAEHHSIRGLGANLIGLKVPSPLRGVFGIVTVGTHMNMYTIKGVDGDSQTHIWVAKRSQNVTYAGKLDQLVAGAMGPRDDNNPLTTLRREAMEEAGLTVNVETGQVCKDGEYVGLVRRGSWISFFDKKDAVAGSEHGQLEPGIRFTFDLEVDAEFVPQPCEPESIAGFILKTVEEVKSDLKCREWKPNCALVMLDFLLRKGQIQPEDDAFFRHLKPALQRRLPFSRI